MPKKGDWLEGWGIPITVLFALYVAFCAILTLTYKAHHEDQRHAAAQGRAGPYHPEAEPFVETPSAAPNIASGLEDEARARREEARSAYDLHSQHDMAEAALVAVLSGIGALFLTGVGVAYVAATLGATRATVAATREIGEVQTRGDVHIRDGEICLADNMVNVRLPIFSTGNTPIYEVRSSICRTDIITSTRRKLIHEGPPVGVPNRVDTLVPGERENELWPVARVKFDWDITAEPATIWAYVTLDVSWRDAFGKSFRQIIRTQSNIANTEPIAGNDLLLGTAYVSATSPAEEVGKSEHHDGGVSNLHAEHSAR